MCIGAEEGCQDVPEPIAPIDIVFLSLEPTRTPMSSFVITIKAPMFMDPVCIPGIWPIGLDAGLAEGIGIFISICGDGEGVGDESGIFMLGISSIVRGVGEGFAF